MACCKTCCGCKDCTPGQAGKCCCGGAGGECCTTAQTCCGGSCCDNVCCNGVCCQPGESCVNGNCVNFSTCCQDITKLPSSLTVTLSNWRNIRCARNGLTVPCTQDAIDFAQNVIDHTFVLSERQLIFSNPNSCMVIYSTPASSGECVFSGSIELELKKNTSAQGLLGGYSCATKFAGTSPNFAASSVPTLDELCAGIKTFPATYESGVRTELIVLSQEVYVSSSLATINIEATFNPLP